MQEETTLLCPFCEEGELQKVRCAGCGKSFLRCDECDSVYKDKKSLDEDFGAECPHCGASIE